MDYITGEDFFQIEGVALVHTHDLGNYLYSGNAVNDIIVAHNSDGAILDTPGRDCDFYFQPDRIPENVKVIYCQNCDVQSDILEPLPIFLEREFWHPGKMETLKNTVEKKIQKHPVSVYMCHSIFTNLGERQEPYDLFDKFNWVTCDHGKNGQNFKRYIENIARHQFMICPEGHGLDTHRALESLYCGTIPIVKRRVFTERFAKLFPMLIVDSWSEVTYQRLERAMVEFRGIKYDQYLDFSWWKDKILKGERIQ